MYWQRGNVSCKHRPSGACRDRTRVADTHVGAVRPSGTHTRTWRCLQTPKAHPAPRLMQQLTRHRLPRMCACRLAPSRQASPALDAACPTATQQSTLCTTGKALKARLSTLPPHPTAQPPPLTVQTTKTHVQVGNAVPPPLARALGSQLLKALQVGGYLVGGWVPGGYLARALLGERVSQHVYFCVQAQGDTDAAGPLRSRRAQAKAKAGASKEAQE